jgi:hypothetical protein
VVESSVYSVFSQYFTDAVALLLADIDHATYRCFRSTVHDACDCLSLRASLHTNDELGDIQRTLRIGFGSITHFVEEVRSVEWLNAAKEVFSGQAKRLNDV